MASPDSPSFSTHRVGSPPGSDASPGLGPTSFEGPSLAHVMSPGSDIVGPSPVTSNGTEIEDEVAEETTYRSAEYASRLSLTMLKTNLPDDVRRDGGEEVVSVIHAPEGFDVWTCRDAPTRTSMSLGGTALPGGVLSPPPSEPAKSPPSRGQPTTVDTRVRPAVYRMDAHTPQAQNLEDVLGEPARPRSSSRNSLELIAESPESHETDCDHVEEDPYDACPSPQQALRGALQECWTLCNTLASLSSMHRERMFADAEEKAWKCCWKLCKRLYQSRDDTSESFKVRTNLDLCRDFCQALFDVRQTRNDGGDAVLRVSFELNNHLYSAQDSRNLPEAFRERTLDFYITLCHRLMKQRSELAGETDSLLRACWTLAEMLFSIRQNRRDGQAEDEELLGSAVQACWELCDMFREGVHQMRPERSTPRPTQVNLFMAERGGKDIGLAQAESRSQAGSRTSVRSKPSLRGGLPDLEKPLTTSSSSSSSLLRATDPVLVPETPVTEFEDTPVSPEISPQPPNMLVLGTTVVGNRRGHWSSNASQLSSFSKSSAHTSSTATTSTTTATGAHEEHANMARVKMLVIKAAMNIGFNRDDAERATTSSSASSSVVSSSAAMARSATPVPPTNMVGALFHVFVKSLPMGSFGSLPTHTALLQNYKKLVLSDPAFRAPGPGPVPSTAAAPLPARGKRASAFEVAKSVQYLIQRSPSQYGFLRELFRIVFGFPLEEAEARRNVTISV